MRFKRQQRFKKIISYTLLFTLIIFFFFPIYWMILTAFKPAGDAFAIPPKFVFTPTLEAFEAIFNPEIVIERGKTAATFHWIPPLPPAIWARNTFNSIIVAITSTIICLFIGMLGAYALSRYNPLIANKILYIIIGLRMLPPIAVLLPYYIIMKTLGLVDTYVSIVLAHTALNLPFILWLLWGFMKDLPRELDESAMIDGCTEYGCLIRIILPIAAPAMVTAAIFAFIWSWNEFLFALVLTARNTQTLPVMMATYISEEGPLWSYMCATGSLITLPPLVIAFTLSKYFMRGLAFGAIKG